MIRDKELSEGNESREFFPIALDTIKVERLPRMDLYIQRDEKTPPVLYLSRSLPLEKNDLKELKEFQIENLWVSAGDFGEYDKYLDSNVSELIQDPSVSVEMKCELTYNASAQVMEQVFNSPEPQTVIKASARVLNPIIDVIFENRKASHQFILQSSMDYELYTHSVNVCLYGMALARRALGISKQEALKRFGPGFLLHDIGMTRIAKEILQKKEPLTNEEYEIIKRHPIDGLEMVKEFMEVTPESESIILHHHEYLDGSGYPFGLVGPQISKAARICAISNTFDNLSTRRPYRDRKSSFDALKSMRQELPHRLDEQLYQEFIYLFLPPE